MTAKIVIAKSADGQTRVTATYDKGSCRMSLAEIAALFEVAPASLRRHLKHIYDEGECAPPAAKKAPFEAQGHGLDAVVALAFRVRSMQAAKFRIWASRRLRELMLQGFSLDEDRLSEPEAAAFYYETLNALVEKAVKKGPEEGGHFEVSERVLLGLR
jgi:hypothetical protein